MSNKPNERKRYRVQSPSKEALSVVVKFGRSTIPGKVADLSVGGIALLFDHRYDPVFPLKGTLFLELSSPHLPKPLLVHGQVRRREETEKGRIYGFEFIDWPALLARLPQALTSLFNRRGHHRVEPDPSKPIEVTIEGSLLTRPIRATLRDLSAAGISVQAPYALENLLMRVERVKVSFCLPYDPGPLSFWGSIMHRNLIGKGICYGILFDARRTAGFPAKQESLVRYVADRQGEKQPQELSPQE